MNYFSLFDINEGFYLDEKALKKRYYILSKKYHPDHYTLSVADEQLAALDKSALINEAYNTLVDFDSRMHYILQMHEVLVDGNNDIPQSFLMEMMDINEELFELEMEPDKDKVSKIKSSIENIKLSNIDTIKSDLESYPTDNDQVNLSILNKAKDYYLKNKYLLRILDKISKFAVS
jgi:molecular chaperone HscB